MRTALLNPDSAETMQNALPLCIVARTNTRLCQLGLSTYNTMIVVQYMCWVPECLCVTLHPWAHDFNVPFAKYVDVSHG